MNAGGGYTIEEDNVSAPLVIGHGESPTGGVEPYVGDLSPILSVPFPGVAADPVGIVAAEQHEPLTGIVVNDVMEAAGGWPGVGDFGPCATIPLPCVILSANAGFATEQHHSLAGGIIRHCMSTSGAWSDILFLRPEPTFGHVRLRAIRTTDCTSKLATPDSTGLRFASVSHCRRLCYP